MKLHQLQEVFAPLDLPYFCRQINAHGGQTVFRRSMKEHAATTTPFQVSSSVPTIDVSNCARSAAIDKITTDRNVRPVDKIRSILWRCKQPSDTQHRHCRCPVASSQW